MMLFKSSEELRMVFEGSSKNPVILSRPVISLYLKPRHETKVAAAINNKLQLNLRKELRIYFHLKQVLFHGKYPQDAC